jgi:hypothetical protein
MAVERRTKASAYVTGVVKAARKLVESIDETPLVARAVYPPET